jgi:hypothetical protein
LYWCLLFIYFVNQFRCLVDGISRQGMTKAAAKRIELVSIFYSVKSRLNAEMPWPIMFITLLES